MTIEQQTLEKVYGRMVPQINIAILELTMTKPDAIIALNALNRAKNLLEQLIEDSEDVKDREMLNQDAWSETMPDGSC